MKSWLSARSAAASVAESRLDCAERSRAGTLCAPALLRVFQTSTISASGAFFWTDAMPFLAAEALL
jgi:hypothetical protein